MYVWTARRTACTKGRSDSRSVGDLALGSDLDDWHMNMLRLLLVCTYVCILYVCMYAIFMNQSMCVCVGVELRSELSKDETRAGEAV